MTKVEYEAKCKATFEAMTNLSLQEKIKIYFEKYLIFGTSTDCKICKIVRETGISKEEIKSLIGSVLKEGMSKGFVQIN